MGLVGCLELCNDILGPAVLAQGVWHKGQELEAGLERKVYAMLDRVDAGWHCGIRNNGAESRSVS